MGQKVNPIGFRIGVNKGWQSVSFVEKGAYASTLREDLELRDYINKNLSSAGVVDIKTKRSMNNLLIEISVARPGVVIGRGGSGIEKVKKDLAKITKSKIEVKLFEVKDPDGSAKLMGEAIAGQVARRIVPKFAAQREIEKAKAVANVKGIRVWVSGRIKGAEIARTEKFQWGSVPLQTLRADIDYAYIAQAVPNAGIHGIKVWIYKGEKQSI